MTDALINNKPQFVRLFNENGLNILDYLTYQRLEGLYRSLSSSSLAYTLLQRRLTERQSLAKSVPTVPCSPDEPTPLKRPQSPMSPISGPSSAKELSLYEVRRGCTLIHGTEMTWYLLKNYMVNWSNRRGERGGMGSFALCGGAFALI